MSLLFHVTNMEAFTITIFLTTGDSGMEVRSSSGKEPRAVRLPGDLVAEILARVPYRSLCRFKLVSRSWRALCSDPAVRRRCAPRPWLASSYAPCPSAPPLGTSATSSMCRGEVRPWSTPPSRSCQPATGTRASSTPATGSSCANARMRARTTDLAVISSATLRRRSGLICQTTSGGVFPTPAILLPCAGHLPLPCEAARRGA